MPKPNYQFEKRQKELAKKRKQEEKRLRKAAERGESVPADGATPAPAPAEEKPDPQA